MDSPDGFVGPVNLGNPHEISIRDLAELIIELTGSKSKLEYRPLPIDDPKQRCPDITRALERLDWAPTTPLDTGLRLTIAYFESQLSKGALTSVA